MIQIFKRVLVCLERRIAIIVGPSPDVVSKAMVGLVGLITQSLCKELDELSGAAFNYERCIYNLQQRIPFCDQVLLPAGKC